MCEIRFPGAEQETGGKEKFSWVSSELSELRSNLNDLCSLTFTAGWCEVLHQENKEVVELQEAKNKY